MQLNSWISYPGHGIGKVIRQDVKADKTYWVIKISRTGMTILIPKSKQFESSVGIRSLAGKGDIKKALSLLNNPENLRISLDPWSVRYAEAKGLLEGSVFDLVTLVLDLKSRPNLSFGEQKMLDVATEILEDEMRKVYNKNFKVSKYV